MNPPLTLLPGFVTKTFFRPTRVPLAPVVLLVLVLTAAQAARAQAACASDGQAQPVALLERFINADCAECWADGGTAKAGAGQVALDWVVPGATGDDAPLSAVANRDGLLRLQALGKDVPSGSASQAVKVQPSTASRLRVAHGVALSGYVGVSIEFKPLPQQLRGKRLSSWLALVETIPPGTEGTPVERNLVRNLLQPNWILDSSLSKKERIRFFESRAMGVAEGTNPDRLRLIGWVEDDNGRVVAAAQSRCAL